MRLDQLSIMIRDAAGITFQLWGEGRGGEAWVWTYGM